MRKKLMTATVALVAFASLAGTPGTASATNDPGLTYPTGTLLAAGSSVKALNVGILNMTSSAGGTTCSAGELKGTLAKNNGSELQADIESFTAREPVLKVIAQLPIAVSTR